jgi:hypothetical protein
LFSIWINRCMIHWLALIRSSAGRYLFCEYYYIKWALTYSHRKKPLYCHWMMYEEK